MARTEAWPPKVINHRGRARVRIHGKDTYLGKFGSAEANEAYRKLLSDHQPKGDVMAGAVYPTIAFLCGKFLEAKEAERGKDWKELIQYRYSFRAFVRLHGQRRAADFKARDLESLQIAMATGDWMSEAEQQQYQAAGKPIGVSRGVIRHRAGRIKTMWRWAEREGLAPEGSAAHLATARLPDLQDKRVRKTPGHAPTSRADLDRVLPLLLPPVAAMLELQWLTGMRSGEVRIMRQLDIDRSGPVWVYRPTQHKGLWRGHERAIHLGPNCKAILTSWLDGKSEYLFPPKYRGKERHPFYSQEHYAQAVRKACVKAGVKITPYGGRHSFAMRVAREHGLESARIALGQTDPGTIRHYLSVDLDHAAEIAKKVG